MDFHTLAAECAPWIHVQTLATIARRESSFKPYRININYDSNGKRGYTLSREPRNEQEAVTTARDLLNQGFNIDVGLFGVNSDNFKKYGLKVDEAFKPCRNMQVGGSIFYWNYQTGLKDHPNNQQQALRVGFSIYNTGSKIKGFQNGYVQKIENSAHLPIPNVEY